MTALLVSLLGGAAIITGIALISVPAAVIFVGICLVIIGLFGLEAE